MDGQVAWWWLAIALAAGFVLGGGLQRRGRRGEVQAAHASQTGERIEALAPATREEIVALLSRNKYIEAIKVCRERTGFGLKEAKLMVDALRMRASGGEGPSASTVQGGPAAFDPLDGPDAVSEMPADLRAELEPIVREKRVIEAIKLCRERTGWDLKQAKEAVEALKRRLDRG